MLFGFVDADCRSLYVEVGCNDGEILRNSRYNIALEDNTTNLSENDVLVGGDALPLPTNLFQPYSRNSVIERKSIQPLLVQCPKNRRKCVWRTCVKIQGILKTYFTIARGC